MRSYVVIGGGLAGLSAAHRLLEAATEPVRVTLLEASSRLGGVIETIPPTAPGSDGCLIERGADSFITNKSHAVSLCERLGLADQLLPTDDRYRRSLVLAKGRPEATPNGLQLLLPTDIDAILDSPILSEAGKQRFLEEEQIPPRTDDSEESLAAFARRRFGDEMFERLIQPLVGGIYTADPEQLSLQATLPRFREQERQYGSLIVAGRKVKARSQASAGGEASGARYGLFLGLEYGMRSLFDALKKRIAERGEIRFGHHVRAIHRRGANYELQVNTGEETIEILEADGIVIAVPSHAAAPLLSSIDDELSSALRTIRYASSAILVTLHDLDSFTHPMDAFGLVVPEVERRDILAVSFSSRKFPNRCPDGQILLRTFLGGMLQEHLLAQSDDELLEIVRRELTDIFGMTAPERMSVTTRWNHAMPQYTLGHQRRVAEIERLAAEIEGVELAGNAHHGVGIPDVIASGERAAERLLGQANLSGSSDEPTTPSVLE